MGIFFACLPISLILGNLFSIHRIQEEGGPINVVCTLRMYGPVVKQALHQNVFSFIGVVEASGRLVG